MSALQNTEDNQSSDGIHSPIIAGAKFQGTPVYEQALSRLLALGLSIDEAEALLKD